MPEPAVTPAPAPRGAVVIPTYNEAENIERLVRQILNLGLSLQVIVVDDNSPDGTGDIAERLAGENSLVGVVHRAGKLGLGTAYIAGFKKALADGVPIVFSMDADFSHSPTYLPAMVEMSRTRDLVIGSRYVPGGGTSGCTAPRKALSHGANLFAKVLLGLKAQDCTAGFRCYRRQVLESIEMETIFSSGYSFLNEMLNRCEKRGYRRRGAHRRRKPPAWRLQDLADRNPESYVHRLASALACPALGSTRSSLPPRTACPK
jgi:dolichol-phosphate mannosyltransferase